MSLADKVTVKAHYTRSVNLERDFQSPELVRSYIPTTRAVQTLGRMADTLTADAMPRAWSLIGPYGADKSSFAAFLTCLLCGPETERAQTAMGVLQRAEIALADRYRELQADTNGHCVVVLIGSPEPMGRRLAQALAGGAVDCWANRSGRRPRVVGQLQCLAGQERLQASDLLTAVGALQAAPAQSGANGLLVVIEELGKFLEYEARYYGANDIFLLQALAERANVAHTAKLTLIVLLRQAMDQYARGLSETLRNEWMKVQGRFETVPFIETAEQVLRIPSRRLLP